MSVREKICVLVFGTPGCFPEKWREASRFALDPLVEMRTSLRNKIERDIDGNATPTQQESNRKD
jgi:hypothetical protein